MPECSAGLGPRFKESLLYMHSPDTRSKADNRRGGNFTKTAVLYIVVGHAEHGASIRVSLCLQGAATTKLRDHPGLGAPESRPYIYVYIYIYTYIYIYIYIYMVVRCAFSPPPLSPQCPNGIPPPQIQGPEASRPGGLPLQACRSPYRLGPPVPQKGGGGFSFLPGPRAQLENHKTAAGISCSTAGGGGRGEYTMTSNTY